MPKRTDIKSILIIGAGPIVIGQACEFDYSGTQACKTLKEEGYRIILINSNPATIMTDPEIADSTYIEPIHWKIIKKIIQKEKPDAILPTMGGQVALNCTLQLYKKKILSEYNVKIIGASIQAIQKSEDRNLFKQSMKKIGLETAICKIVHNIEEALHFSKIIGFPCIIRPSYTMGGTGGGIAYNYEEFKKICKKGFQLSPTKEILIDESLLGWKEYEMEVVRDCNNNCIIVCSIENFDPIGIHTGDSITIAPAQTLTDKEYQYMRNASIKILEEIGVETGGSNVQFAINPKNGRMLVIEMNPRVSRSSALASKATGFPIAKIAAKLAIGYTLDELKNDITNSKIPASFEPTIDYVVTKIPRFNFEKFSGCNDRLTTQMKSIGEVMAIGKTFQESIQKAMQGLEIDSNGFDPKVDTKDIKNIRIIKNELKNPGAERLWYIADAFRANMSVKNIYQLTSIDPWFLTYIQDIIKTEEIIKNKNIDDINYDFLKKIKKKGFSDLRIAILMNVSENEIRKIRYQLKLHPTYKRIDTCAAEFHTETAYMYSTWAEECEAHPSISNKKIIILGSGPNRIGQGIEFDYCCVHAAQALIEEGFETIMVNCNPETVSTDYDISHRLYFESITLENILEITRIEKPFGVIVQYGGQTPLKLAKKLQEFNIPIIGTSPNNIDKAEDRHQFQKIVSSLNLKQPKNATVKTIQQGLNIANNIKYPIMVRPSYVLGGRFMKIVYNITDLKEYFNKTLTPSKKNPILLDHYLENATEIDVDIICDTKHVLIGGIMEHIEPAGIHSGDSSCSLPTYTVQKNIKNKIKEQVLQLALSLSVKGLMNVQLAIQNNKIYILEVNPRASRTIPFVSKATNIPLAKIAAKVMIGKTLKQQKYHNINAKSLYFAVKESVLPFNKFPGVDPILGPEMRSTGEVMGIGKTFASAFAKAKLASQTNIKKINRVLLSIKKSDEKYVINLSIILIQIGFQIDTTEKIHHLLKNSGIHSRIVNQINEGRPNIQDHLKNKEYSYIIDTTHENTYNTSYPHIRFLALSNNIYYDTTINAAFATILSLKTNPYKEITKLQDINTVFNYDVKHSKV
ncbi:carbamoyl-phosphate synthase large subunit [Buchnera aphidicola]|uniref:Carbamoyl phosphate synthase large chain n=1 Tax=Buchnera aphidicola (Sarucallis kahawaluokalani) TaxID=1241878 RepID=A0A4D6Y9P6_9GAMM|nr:carbamoyl-phosphate synthase large subunit [Buchnera aphidicola]QCI25902.1 carbamoyl-phosphate synthase large subunit [Buchnera aphidicola (Sarucallis kahawaluokalani)]